MSFAKRQHTRAHPTADELWIAKLQSRYGSTWVLEYWRSDRSGRFFRSPEALKEHLAEKDKEIWKKMRCQLRIQQLQEARRHGIDLTAERRRFSCVKPIHATAKKRK